MGSVETAPSPKRTALVVEDETNIRDLVCLHLGVEGFTCVPAGTGTDALELASRQRFDLIVLDLMLPGIDGVTMCRAVRRGTTNADTPILMLTARREETDKVLGLDSGADDYLTKPFGVGELLARLRVALRHATRGPERSQVFESGPVKVDLGARRVEAAGREVHLTPIEYRLLSVLVKHAGKVLTHRQLLKEVWGPSHVEHAHYLRIYMAQLRRKLEEDPAQPRFLLTEPGVGYRLAAG